MPEIGYRMGGRQTAAEYSAALRAKTRRSILVDGLIALALVPAAAEASVPLVQQSDAPDALDAHAEFGMPGYSEDLLRFNWLIYLDGRLLNQTGRNRYLIRAADQRAGFVDVYDEDRAGHPNWNVSRLYGRVRIIRGDRI